MMNDLVIDIERVGDLVAFVFTGGPISFVSLIVSANDTGDDLWELHPIGMDADIVSSGGTFAAIEVGSPDESHDFWKVVESLRPVGEKPALPLCEKVNYGVAPLGYREIAPAKPLHPGTSYSVVVLNPRAGAAREFIA